MANFNNAKPQLLLHQPNTCLGKMACKYHNWVTYFSEKFVMLSVHVLTYKIDSVFYFPADKPIFPLRGAYSQC